MKTVGNIIWLVCAGLWLALGYFIAGIIACCLIVTIPFGVASFRIGAYALWPFGRTVNPSESKGAVSGVANVIWAIGFGWWLALAHILTAAFLAITVIGLPLAAANVKMIPVSFTPFGRRIVPTNAVTTRGDAVAIPEVT